MPAICWQSWTSSRQKRNSRAARSVWIDPSFRISSDRSLCNDRKVAGPLQVDRVLRAFRQRSVANEHDGRISTKANLVDDGPGNVLDQRLKVVSGELWLGAREPPGRIGRVCGHAVVVQGFSIPSHSEFAHIPSLPAVWQPGAS